LCPPTKFQRLECPPPFRSMDTCKLLPPGFTCPVGHNFCSHKILISIKSPPQILLLPMPLPQPLVPNLCLPIKPLFCHVQLVEQFFPNVYSGILVFPRVKPPPVFLIASWALFSKFGDTRRLLPNCESSRFLNLRPSPPDFTSFLFSFPLGDGGKQSLYWLTSFSLLSLIFPTVLTFRTHLSILQVLVGSSFWAGLFFLPVFLFLHLRLHVAGKVLFGGFANPPLSSRAGILFGSLPVAGPVCSPP